MAICAKIWLTPRGMTIAIGVSDSEVASRISCASWRALTCNSSYEMACLSDSMAVTGPRSWASALKSGASPTCLTRLVSSFLAHRGDGDIAKPARKLWSIGQEKQALRLYTEAMCRSLAIQWLVFYFTLPRSQSFLVVCLRLGRPNGAL